MNKIVIDTNVVVSAALKSESLPALLMSLVYEGKLRLFISPYIFSEYEEVLKRPRFGLTIKDIEAFLRVIKDKAQLVNPTKKISRIKADEKDNRILECAYECGADFIITGISQHFPFQSFRGIKIVNPREFINLMDLKE